MPKPYSLDLRERVVRFVDEGHSRHAAAAHFRVSVSFVVNLVNAFRVRGSLAPSPLPFLGAELSAFLEVPQAAPVVSVLVKDSNKKWGSYSVSCRFV